MQREEKKKILKNKIIDALIHLMSTTPFELISVNAICEEAAISKRTLYIYFASKDDMYLELVYMVFDKMRMHFEQTLTDNALSLNEKILIIGRSYLEFCLGNPVFGNLIVNFEEDLYLNDYRERVEAISKVANQYELNTFFQNESANLDLYTPSLALYLWSQVQGFAQLALNKKLWLSRYYQKSIDLLIEDQISEISNYLSYKTTTEVYSYDKKE